MQLEVTLRRRFFTTHELTYIAPILQPKMVGWAFAHLTNDCVQQFLYVHGASYYLLPFAVLDETRPDCAAFMGITRQVVDYWNKHWAFFRGDEGFDVQRDLLMPALETVGDGTVKGAKGCGVFFEHFCRLKGTFAARDYEYPLGTLATDALLYLFQDWYKVALHVRLPLKIANAELMTGQWLNDVEWRNAEFKPCDQETKEDPFCPLRVYLPTGEKCTFAALFENLEAAEMFRGSKKPDCFGWGSGPPTKKHPSLWVQFRHIPRHAFPAAGRVLDQMNPDDGRGSLSGRIEMIFARGLMTLGVDTRTDVVAWLINGFRKFLHGADHVLKVVEPRGNDKSVGLPPRWCEMLMTTGLKTGMLNDALVQVLNGCLIAKVHQIALSVLEHYMKSRKMLILLNPFYLSRLGSPPNRLPQRHRLASLAEEHDEKQKSKLVAKHRWPLGCYAPAYKPGLEKAKSASKAPAKKTPKKKLKQKTKLHDAGAAARLASSSSSAASTLASVQSCNLPPDPVGEAACAIAFLNADQRAPSPSILGMNFFALRFRDDWQRQAETDAVTDSLLTEDVAAVKRTLPALWSTKFHTNKHAKGDGEEVMNGMIWCAADAVAQTVGYKLRENESLENLYCAGTLVDCDFDGGESNIKEQYANALAFKAPYNNHTLSWFADVIAKATVRSSDFADVPVQSLRSVNDMEWNLVHYAAGNGRADLVHVLSQIAPELAQGRDLHKNSPMIFAVMRGSVPTVVALTRHAITWHADLETLVSGNWFASRFQCFDGDVLMKAVVFLLAKVTTAFQTCATSKNVKAAVSVLTLIDLVFPAGGRSIRETFSDSPVVQAAGAPASLTQDFRSVRRMMIQSTEHVEFLALLGRVGPSKKSRLDRLFNCWGNFMCRGKYPRSMKSTPRVARELNAWVGAALVASILESRQNATHGERDSKYFGAHHEKAMRDVKVSEQAMSAPYFQIRSGCDGIVVHDVIE